MRLRRKEVFIEEDASRPSRQEAEGRRIERVACWQACSWLRRGVPEWIRKTGLIALERVYGYSDFIQIKL
jgi:hypothetical protein